MWLTAGLVRRRSFVNDWYRKLHITCISYKGSSNKTSFYSVLGLEPSATHKEIRHAYIELSKKYHADFNPGDALAASKFHDVSEAYSTLGDAKLRRQYDRGQLGRMSSVADRDSIRHRFEGDRFVDTREDLQKSYTFRKGSYNPVDEYVKNSISSNAQRKQYDAEGPEQGYKDYRGAASRTSKGRKIEKDEQLFPLVGFVGFAIVLFILYEIVGK